MSKSSTETVKVMVRVRPMNKKELAKGCKSVVKINAPTNQVELQNPDQMDNPAKAFTFDATYDIDSQQ